MATNPGESPTQLGAMPERDRLVQFYQAELARYGPDDPRALHWISQHTQGTRFKVLYELLHDWRGISIADIGCGLGDFCGFLTEQGHPVVPLGDSSGGSTLRPGAVQYVGYDISPKLITAAKEKYPQGRFEVRDILSEGMVEPVDYVMVCGTFNIRLENHEKFLFDMLRVMYESCRRAVAFNFLAPAKSDSNFEGFYYSIEPEKVMTFCRSLEPNLVQMRENYLSGDCTILMRKDDAPWLMGGQPAAE